MSVVIDSSTFQTVLNLTTALRFEDFKFIDSAFAIDSYFGSCIIKLPYNNVSFTVMSQRQNKLMQKFAKNADAIEIIEDNSGDVTTYTYVFRIGSKKIGQMSVVEGRIQNDHNEELLQELDIKPALKFNVDASLIARTLQTITEANVIEFEVNKKENRVTITIKGDDDLSVQIEGEDVNITDDCPETFYVQAINALFIQPCENTTIELDAENNKLIVYQNHNVSEDTNDTVQLILVFDTTTENVSDMVIQFEHEDT